MKKLAKVKQSDKDQKVERRRGQNLLRKKEEEGKRASLCLIQHSFDIRLSVNRLAVEI